MDIAEIEIMLKQLDRERQYLEDRGFVFPALYEAVAALLRQHMPE